MKRLNKPLYENRLERSLQQLTYSKVLIIDEIVYPPHARVEVSFISCLVMLRYERASLVMTSNKSFLD